jgi:hypothetical protein
VFRVRNCERKNCGRNPTGCPVRSSNCCKTGKKTRKNTTGKKRKTNRSGTMRKRMIWMNWNGNCCCGFSVA